MSDFPSLQPAMTILIELGDVIGVGSASKGTPLAVAPLPGGSIKSEPGFSPALDAEWVGTGADYIHNDPSGERMRLNAHGVVKDKSGGVVYLNYTGIVDITPELGAILSQKPDAKTTEFGNSCKVSFAGHSVLLSASPKSFGLTVALVIEMRFETGDEKLKSLETMTFVGAGRFRVEQGKPVVVEYKLSKVVKGK